MLRRLLGIAALSAILAWHGTAPLQAEEPSVLMRFYYSNWVSGSVLKSPHDPSGVHADAPLENLVKGEAELIFFKHVGLGYGRQKIGRLYQNAGVNTTEFALQTYGSLTLYATESRHFGFNMFAGRSWGSADFEVTLNGVPQEDVFYENIPILRTFGGFEYTLDRIGFRLEAMRVQGEKNEGGRIAEISQRLGYFTIYIPFN